MYKYKVQIKKVSGRLNESVLPSKNLVVKSKTKKSKSTVLAEASKFFKKKYGLVIESGDVDETPLDSVETILGAYEDMVTVVQENMPFDAVFEDEYAREIIEDAVHYFLTEHPKLARKLNVNRNYEQSLLVAKKSGLLKKIQNELAEAGF